MPGLEFGHFLVRVPIARRVKTEQPRASALGTTSQRNRPERAAESALTRTCRYVVITFDAPVPFPPDCARGLLYEGSAAVPAF